MRLTTAGCLIVVCSAACGAAFGQVAQFEAASVRPHTAAAVQTPDGAIVGGMKRGGPGTADPGQISYSGFTLERLLLDAYGLKNYQISAPGWLHDEEYDVTAKIPAGATKEQFNLMLRHLLTERFQMTLHLEVREFSGRELVVGKNGPKLGAAEAVNPECAKLAHDPRGNLDVSFEPKGICLAVSEQPMTTLAEHLGATLAIPVVDKTGLTGKYDFTLFYSAEGTKFGSEQEFDKRPILRGFPEHDEFGFGDGHALSLEE